MDTRTSSCRKRVPMPDQEEQEQENRAVEVEIGFGDGDYLLRRAAAYPDRTFIGIEQKTSLITGISKKAASLHIDNIQFVASSAKDAFSDHFTMCSISRVYALFPDPWPKRRHIKYRLFSANYLRLLNNRLVQRGEVMIVTDSEEYYRWILKQTPDTGFEIECGTIPPQFNTRFERKWVGQGYSGFFRILLRKIQHLDT